MTPVLALANYDLPDGQNGSAPGFSYCSFGCSGSIMPISDAIGVRDWRSGKDHGPVTGGVYRRMRQPMYAAILLSPLTKPVLVQNWIAGLLVVLAFAAMFHPRAE